MATAGLLCMCFFHIFFILCTNQSAVIHLPHDRRIKTTNDYWTFFETSQAHQHQVIVISAGFTGVNPLLHLLRGDIAITVALNGIVH